MPDSFVNQMRSSLWYRQFRLYLIFSLFRVALVSERRQESELKVAYSSCAAISCNASRGDE